MKRNEFCKTLFRLSLMCLLFIAIPQRSAAQIDAEKANFNGEGLDITTGITFATQDENTKFPSISDAAASRVLLYNVGKDMLLNAGGFWGTRTATFTVGLPVIMSKITTTGGMLYPTTDVSYYFRGPFNNAVQTGTGSLLAFVDDKGAKRGVFWDRGTKGSAAINNPSWKFEDVTDKLSDDNKRRGKVYRIYITLNGENYYLCSGCAMSVHVFKDGNDNLVRALTDKERAEYEYEDKTTGDKIKGLPEENTYWQLVTEEGLENSFTEDYKDAPLADATFMLRAQGFNISNVYNNKSYNRGWETKGKVQYETNFSAAFPGLNSDNLHKTLAPNFAMFQCAGLRNAEAGSKIFQTVTLSKSGWYMVECQGFYNDATEDEAVKRDCYAYLYAKFLNDDGSEPNKNSVLWATTPLLGKSNLENDQKSMGDFENTLNPETFKDISTNNDYCPDNATFKYLLLEGFGDHKISNKVEAGVAFYSKKYPNAVMVYVNIPSGKKVMELGIELPNGLTTNDADNADAVNNDYVYVDDFRVKYLGESFALCDEWKSFDIAGNDPKDQRDYDDTYRQKAMIFKRNFTTGKWNSICLPVDLQKWQLKNAFSGEVKLARMSENPVKEGRIEFELVSLDGAQDDVGLKRGECYLIKPGVGSLIEDNSIKVGNLNNNNILPPYYIIPNVSLQKNEMEKVLSNNGDPKSVVYNKFHSLDYDRNGGTDYSINKSYGLTGTKYAECQLDIYATFENEAVAPANSYVFHKGSLYHITKPTKVPGYSWWIVDKHQDEEQVGVLAKRHLLSFDADGTTTGIEEITSDTTVRESVEVVYNLWGQAVRCGTTDLSGLPSGIYIVDGKKVSVK